MSFLYEFIVKVELNEEVEKKTQELANANNYIIHGIQSWVDTTSTIDETFKVREIVFLSQYNIYNNIVQYFSGDKIVSINAYTKFPLVVQ
jgi:hypothetical protein